VSTNADRIPKSWRSAAQELTVMLNTSSSERPSTPVNISRFRHAAIALAFHQAAYALPKGTLIPFMFLDGSLSEHFPFGGLAPVQGVEKPGQTLAVGLMSFRHPELDFLVDCYVTRNRELALQSSMAEEEQLSYERTKQFLADPIFDSGCEIIAYHTGLEPMVVGFYRAVSETLRNRQERGCQRNLRISPHFFHGRPTKENLSAASPGARHESYLPGPTWQ
jgi:hypothetical protein